MPGVSPPSLDDDRAMVHAALSGQPGAFAALVHAHQRLVWLLVQRLVRDPEDARELGQEAFMRVSQRLHQFRFESSLRTWIGRIATSVALRHLERQRLPTVEIDEALPLPAADDTAAEVDARQQHERLRDAIDALAPVPRLVVTLFYLEELPVAEVAALTGLPDNTVKSHLARSRARLRQHLETSR
ncbi:sigma-70 family RNA polymerase sigma factor [Inhella crocodyli]|uniref:Sigma-70 family RNA polymerase sigma factor n=2 Tax=Inhella crocodyli TaxID=2499851 RepID=A0A437LTZ9_9BURK|nr:sigma-70 family RNA polymerase sigma factor [Inhella crocodyli]